MWQRCPTFFTAVRSWSGRHVVEQHRRDAAVERLVELLERVDLDLHGKTPAEARAHPADRDRDRTGDSDVVVLDQDRVVQPGAVIDAAAAGDGVLLEQAQARRRLASVLDGDARAPDRVHHRRRRRRDAGQAAEQVEHHALAGQQRARAAREQRDRAAGGDFGAVGCDDRRARGLRQAGQHDPDGVDTGDAPGFAAPDHAGHRRARRHDRRSRDVAEIAEVFGERARDNAGERLCGRFETHATRLRGRSSATTEVADGVRQLRAARPEAATG